MPLNGTQLRKVLEQDAAKDLGRKLKSNIAVSPEEAKSKITRAIEAAFPGESRTTEANVDQVAKHIDVVLKIKRPDEEDAPQIDTGKAAKDAMDEIKGRDAKMAQAVRMVFNETANGRSAPGTTGIKHIHVGGNAKMNLLFKGKVVLGVVDGHMDRNMSPSVASEADKVAGRARQTTVDVEVEGNEVRKA